MFRIEKKVTGKYRLFRDGADLGDFETLNKAIEGMRILIIPEVHEYDAQGREITPKQGRSS